MVALRIFLDLLLVSLFFHPSMDHVSVTRSKSQPCPPPFGPISSSNCSPSSCQELPALCWSRLLQSGYFNPLFILADFIKAGHHRSPARSTQPQTPPLVFQNKIQSPLKIDTEISVSFLNICRRIAACAAFSARWINTSCNFFNSILIAWPAVAISSIEAQRRPCIPFNRSRVLKQLAGWIDKAYQSSYHRGAFLIQSQFHLEVQVLPWVKSSCRDCVPAHSRPEVSCHPLFFHSFQ